MKPSCVAIGASLGGLEAFKIVLSQLPAEFPVPILIVQHLLENTESALAALLSTSTPLKVFEARDKLHLGPGDVCVAPPNYHLLLDRRSAAPLTFHAALSVEPREAYSRPSIDALFETAALATRGQMVAVVLTGANSDGSRGARCVKNWGGKLLVETPATAMSPEMPAAAIAAARPDVICRLEDMAAELWRLVIC